MSRWLPLSILLVAVVPAAATLPAACSGIRPGAQLVSPSGCTLAWILTDGTDLYAATAGHCVGAEGSTVSVAPNASPFVVGGAPSSVVLGTVVFTRNAGEGFDIAFIRVADAVEASVNPQLCHWGGPTGIYDGDDGAGHLVRQYGHGTGIAVTPETRARSGITSYTTDVGFGYYGVVTNGDSGSPAMLADGRALGVVDTVGASLAIGGDSHAHVGGAGTRLDQGFALLEADKGLSLALVTAPLLVA